MIQFTKDGSKRGRKEEGTIEQPENTNKITLITPYLVIITLSAKILNSLIRRQRVAKEIVKI